MAEKSCSETQEQELDDYVSSSDDSDADELDLYEEVPEGETELILVSRKVRVSWKAHYFLPKIDLAIF